MNPTTSADALKQMQEFSSNRKSLSDIYSGAQQELGVSDAQKRANELKQLTTSTENLIRGVDPSVTGRLQGGLATEAQRQRLVAMETAPLSDLYRTQTGAYETAQSDYNDLYNKANTLASTKYQGDSDKYNSLKDIYGTLTAKEQADEDKRRWEAQMAESKRQASLSSAYASPSFNQNSTKTTGGAMSEQRKDGGFNFTINGKPVSAAMYAQATGKPFRTVLQEMASRGDKGAQVALGFVGNDYGYDPRSIGSNGSLYNALVWGTGKSFTGAASSAPKITNPGLQSMSSSNGLERWQ
jgi:hypothetical protein